MPVPGRTRPKASRLASLFPACFQPLSSLENRSVVSDFHRADLGIAFARLSDDPID